MFKSFKEYRASLRAFFALAADVSDAGKAVRLLRAKKYAVLHPTGQGEFNPPLTDLDMVQIIIDALHCLMLNLPKTLWKYVYGDRMTNHQRCLVAEYLTSVGCPLDVRDKNDGRDANRKWFTGAMFQHFVEGDDAGSPGLVKNIEAINAILDGKAPAPAAPAKVTAKVTAATAAKVAVPAAPPAAPATATPAKNNTTKNGGGGQKKRRGGFSLLATGPDAETPAVAPTDAAPTDAAPTAAKPAAKPAAARTAPAAVPTLADADTPLEAKLRKSYGSHMDSVRLAVEGWSAFGLLYAEWRKPWTSRSQDYKNMRALAFLKVAIQFGKAIEAASLSKHTSWYVWLVVWVVPRQMQIYGDVWAFGTSPVEQRGARLKRIVRNCVSWRPRHTGWVEAHGPSLAGEKAPEVFVARRKYESCAMMQCLRACVAQEEMWDVRTEEAPAGYVGPVQLLGLSASERRMHTQGRTSLIKPEQGSGSRLPTLIEEIIDLTA